jgi:hypothetical protein
MALDEKMGQALMMMMMMMVTKVEVIIKND